MYHVVLLESGITTTTRPASNNSGNGLWDHSFESCAAP
jgi:hypothetical protein